MRILLLNPDNGVTRNFMPHLWMFLLKALTPPEHEVLLIDGNAQRMDEGGIAQYVLDQKIDLVTTRNFLTDLFNRLCRVHFCREQKMKGVV